MPRDPRKRQKKLERRTAKRQEKRHRLVRAQSTGLAQRLAAASQLPVLDSFITEDLWTQGLGWALLSRRLPSGSVAVALFLVDRYCLGVKNCVAAIVDHSVYESEFLRQTLSKFETRKVSPPTVRKLVEQAVAYAADLGFSPHEDYFKGRALFGDLNAAESTEEFEFGKDGKPFFIAGPDDTPDRCRSILAILTNRCGPGGFHYLIPAASDMSVRALPEALRKRLDESDGDEYGELSNLPEDFDEEEER